MNYQMLRDGRSGRILLFVNDCWMLREWLAENIGLDENGSARLCRLDLLEMEEYSAKVMDNPESSSEEYWQAKTMHEGIVKTFKALSPVTRIEYWDCLNDTPVTIL